MSDELTPPSESPLSEADPKSLDHLIGDRINDIFNKAPLLVSDEELTLMIEYYQRERSRFKAESEMKEQRPRGAPRKKPESVAEALAIATEDIL